MVWYPFQRARASWSAGQRILSTMAELWDSQIAQAADGNVYTDLAIAKNWEQSSVATAITGGDIRSIIWNPGDRYWYIFGLNGANPAGLRSISGRASTYTSLTIGAGAGLTPHGGAVAANSSGVIIMGGTPGSASVQKIRESADGTTWNIRSTVASSTERVNSAIWHSGASLFIIGLNNSAATNIETSPDGQTWTQRTGLPNTHARGPMASSGSIVVILAGPTGNPGTSVSTDKCLTTTDGVTYTERTLPTTQTWFGVIWDPRYERFLAFGASNWAYSTDGITWVDGGANPSTVGGVGWPKLGVSHIGRVFLIHGFQTSQCVAGYYDGVTMKQYLVIALGGDGGAAAASDGQWIASIDATDDVFRTFAGGL